MSAHEETPKTNPEQRDSHGRFTKGEHRTAVNQWSKRAKSPSLSVPSDAAFVEPETVRLVNQPETCVQR